MYCIPTYRPRRTQPPPAWHARTAGAVLCGTSGPGGSPPVAVTAVITQPRLIRTLLRSLKRSSITLRGTAP